MVRRNQEKKLNGTLWTTNVKQLIVSNKTPESHVRWTSSGEKQNRHNHVLFAPCVFFWSSSLIKAINSNLLLTFDLYYCLYFTWFQSSLCFVDKMVNKKKQCIMCCLVDIDYLWSHKVNVKRRRLWIMSIWEERWFEAENVTQLLLKIKTQWNQMVNVLLMV